MRILLRQQETGCYLQPSGAWDNNRETAREFLDVAIAYWWAIEEKLLGTEVLLAFMDPAKDFVSIKVRKVEANSGLAVVDCRSADWRQELHSRLYAGTEVDLINFEHKQHGPSCELIAQAFNAEFQRDLVPAAKAVHFRKKAGWLNRPKLPAKDSSGNRPPT